MLDRIPDARAVTSLEELLGAGRATHEPGWILLSSKAPADFLISVISRLQGEVGGWAPLLVLDDDSAPSVAPLLLGYAEALESALPRIRGAEANLGLLSFRALLQDLARIRHDINNPLTAAFAEIQLLLMDAEPESETAEALRIVEAQLYRIRDLAAELTSFRAPVR
jgi:signal transduction histidine kinase